MKSLNVNTVLASPWETLFIITDVYDRSFNEFILEETDVISIGYVSYT
jgi:hypothetical protein